MANTQKGLVSEGFSLLWRRQGVLWWLFVVNIVCGALGTVGAMLALNRALGHSLAGQQLTNGFELGMFAELFRVPQVSLIRASTGSYLFAFVFFLFMLFVTGGILECYRQDRKLTTGEFFGASGAFFWRMVRLLLLSIIPFVAVMMIYQGLSKAADRIGDRAIADQVGIFLGWGAMAIFLLLALVVRLWFDVAQVRAVARNERGMWRDTWKAFRLSFHELPRLWWMYVRISLFAWFTLIVGLVIWAHLPPTALPVSFLILELILLAQLTTRLWQLASTTAWYQGHPEMVMVETAPPVEAVPYVAPPPEPVVDATAVGDPQKVRDPNPELPPADA